MYYSKVDCPHCGNEISVNRIVGRKNIKCYWCRRIVEVKFTGSGKKAKVIVKDADFPDEQKFKFSKFNDDFEG